MTNSLWKSLVPRNTRHFAFAFMIFVPWTVLADDVFQTQVVPFVKQYCVKCHNQKTSEGELDLTRYSALGMLGEDFRQWEHVITFLKKEEMPPVDAKQPPAELRARILKTIEDLLQQEGRKLAGDPGVVLPRRLTNAEYNYTTRDLTGVDIRPAKSFPVDPASGEGFNNTGEALTMSPSLFKKYYAAAELVAEHVLVKPSGWQFAPYSVVTYADQKKFYEGAIIQFYERHNVDYEQYLKAAWSYRHRPAEQRAKSIEQWADQHSLSSRYLQRLWNTLEAESVDDFFMGWLRRRWNALPSRDNEVGAANEIRGLASEIRQLSQMLCTPETAAIVSNAGNPPIVHTERRKKTANERDTFNSQLIRDSQQISAELRNLDKRATISLFIQIAAPNDGNGFVTLSELNFSTQPSNSYKANDKKRNTPFQEVVQLHAPDQLKVLNFGKHPLGDDVAAGSVVLTSPTLLEIKFPRQAFGKEKRIFFHAKATLERKQAKQGFVRIALFDHRPTDEELAKQTGSSVRMPLVNPKHPIADALRKSCTEFCALFPNRFLYVDNTRGLSAGFHLIEGFFRDDRPLCKLVLDDRQNQELDRLWDELYFGTGIAEKLLRGFVFFERSERNFMKHPDFDSIKEEDPELVKDATLSRFRDIYLARSNVKSIGKEREDHAIYRFFETIRHGLKQQAETAKRAAPIYLSQLEDFAQRAYRRPLADHELKRLRTFFLETAQQPEFGVEQAVRASIIRVLVSPNFCYRMDPLPAGNSVKPLPDKSLASRLSYFLWSSMPDADLSALAATGELHSEVNLKAQTLRMLHDPKVFAFALEFFGQWLGYRDFLQQESVNRQLFPNFDDALKQAMFDEPTRVITQLIQRDLPVTDLLSSDVTLVNQRLARHYGVPFNSRTGSKQNDEWVRAEGMRKHGRGGLLGMAVFLTKNSQPERTSPVKRGFWVFHKVLGQHIPAPPADVAVLPAKETDTNGKTIRQLLTLHTDDAKCARCHQRFDPIGLSMEGFDPIGKSRGRDLAGRVIDNIVHLPNGQEVRGVPEFSVYLATQRRQDFIKTLCRKFLGYALGRSLLVSDQTLLEQMETKLKQNDYRFSALFETVVLSPQFRNQRARNFTTAHFRTD